MYVFNKLLLSKEISRNFKKKLKAHLKSTLV